MPPRAGPRGRVTAGVAANERSVTRCQARLVVKETVTQCDVTTAVYDINDGANCLVPFFVRRPPCQLRAEFVRIAAVVLFTFFVFQIYAR